MTPITNVQVKNLSAGAIGPLMNNMRTWLDHQGIEPVDFRSTTLAADDVTVEVEFQHNYQAELFRGAFGN